ncbi:MAG: TIGR00296 family protein [Candidatus Brockarchaeota archaeon]|nr:TIGR00296 family protein [Candidatus Brockarchaeota archaeon]
MELSDEDCKLIVSLARKAITDYLEKGVQAPVPEGAPFHLKEKCGVFVTLHSVRGKKRSLRGCIGFPEPVKPLLEAVIDAAISAAVRDPRFEPLNERELDEIEVEVSVLTPPELIKAAPQEIARKIEIGRDGLIAEKGWNRGLLLPQVPVEEKWDVEEFLMYTCLKAGLEPDCWWDPRTKFYSFQAIVFGEEGPKGQIKRRRLQGPS